MSIFITSDTHFGHNKDFLYAPRGFNAIQDHDKVIIENWNKIVAPTDIVYHLGDVMLNDNEYGIQILSQLNGDIRILRGNHDTDARWELYKTVPNVTPLGFADEIKYSKWRFYLSHRPTMCGNEGEDDKKYYGLCGHTHTKDKFLHIPFKIYHCELDAHNNAPVNIEQIIQDLKNYRENLKV